MGRPIKRVDLSDYKQLPSTTWKEFTRKGNYDAGVLSRLPTSQMLTKKGAFFRRTNDKEKTYQDIKYDREYVMDYYYRKLISALDLMVGETFDDASFERFCRDLKAYSIEIYASQFSPSLDADAEAMAAKYPSKTKEQWLEFLKQQATDSDMDEEDENQHGYDAKK